MIGSKPGQGLPIPRLLIGLALAVSALALMVLFEAPSHGGSAANQPETAAYAGGVAGYAMPLLVFAAVLLFSWIPAQHALGHAAAQPALRYWRAASRAIHVWALFMAGTSVLLTSVLPGLSDSMGWTGAMDGDFPRVLINDFQENSQFSLLLLAFYYGFCLLGDARKGRNEAARTGEA